MKKFNKSLAITLILSLCLTLAAPVDAKSKVKLNITKATLSIGGSINLKLLNNKKKVTWKSSNKKVASVTINRSEDSKNSDAESKVDASVEESAASDNNGTSEQDLAAELYKGNVVKYLIVPEDVEVPVGLEQDMIIVKKPTDHTYAESDEILNMMKDLDLLDNVAAVGMKSKDCTVSEIADKMKAKEAGMDDHIAKPVDAKLLVKVIHKLVG